ncbi:hypothetical protein EBB07_28270 [Paenibacillaceae bacterium]|nr:hypothetical protein EBB07_28270 [Paenibacillaceae bacterium]
MSNVEVKVNVINQLKLLRQSTFKDKLSFLDETVQNAQRAKASKVYVTTDTLNNRVIIENDGAILNNPQALFSIAESEWDEDVQKQESPFGMGFFSNITVSNYIEVYSGKKHIVFDVENMIRTNNTEIIVNEKNEERKGFKLILNHFDFSQFPSYSIRERVELLGRYIHELDIYYNGELQIKKDLTEGDNSTFLKVIEDNELFKGWIALTNFSQELKLFYKGRFITKLDSFYYLKGDLHITDRALNLTAPDRKDIIRDDKYYSFISLIKKYASELTEDSFLNGQASDIETYIDAINNHIDENSVKDKIAFNVLDTEQKEQKKYLLGIALDKLDNPDITTLNQYNVFLKQEAVRQSVGHFDNVEMQADIENKAPEARGVRHYSGSSGTLGYIERFELDSDDIYIKQGSELFDDETIFWFNFNEVLEQEKKIKIAIHYKMKIVVSDNKVEDRILKLLSKDKNIIHISNLNEKVKLKGCVSNTSLSTQEERAMMILEMISRIVGFEHNVFSIGDVMVIRQTEVDALGIITEEVEDSVVYYDAMNNKAYLDRIIIEKCKLRNELSTELDIEDYKFILMNLKRVVDALDLIRFKHEKPKNLYKYIVESIAAA